MQRVCETLMKMSKLKKFFFIYHKTHLLGSSRSADNNYTGLNPLKEIIYCENHQGEKSAFIHQVSENASKTKHNPRTVSKCKKIRL